MSNAHYFYFKLSVFDLEQKVKAYQLDFDQLLNDTFSEAEMLSLEPLLDQIGAAFVQPIFSEMTFDDFYANEKEADSQRSFFENAKSSICLENIPDLSMNPFQVTYIVELLRDFDEVLVDTGGVNELMFKKDYVASIKKHKNIFSLIKEEEKRPLEIKTSKPVDPIDFLLMDVYREIDRLGFQKTEELLRDQSEKSQKILSALAGERVDASLLLKRSGLNAKDFDDGLEKLKFFLKRQRL